MNESHSFFDGLKQHFTKRLPFVAYRKPSSKLVKALLQKDDKLHITSVFSEAGFVFAPFDDRGDAIIIPLKNAIEKSLDFEYLPQAEIGSTKEKGLESDKDQHINLVQKGIEFIETGKLKKVVLSRNESVNLSESNPIELLYRLLIKYPTAFVYCWYHPKVGLWLGATPETLLKLEGNQFETMALAGTQLYKGTLDVVWHDKEIYEQQLVTDFIVDNLKNTVNDLTISKVKTVKAGKLLHLQTKISGTVNLLNTNFKRFINKLHPTPAICGIPRHTAKQFILNNENYKRGFYSGYLGELNYNSKSFLYVNLRCMQLKQNKAFVYVGGGITKDSNPENEWIETVNKSNTIKKVLS